MALRASLHSFLLFMGLLCTGIQLVGRYFEA
jgi:hypothetical protein